MKRVLATIVVLSVLTGCGAPAHVPIVTPPFPSVPIDVVYMLFSTPCRVLKDTNTTVCDTITGSEIRRVTYTVGYMWLGVEVETHSVYGIDNARGCIENRVEETRDHATKAMMATAKYLDPGVPVGTAPCWGPLTVQPGQSYTTRILNGIYEWDHYDAAGNPVPSQHATGRFNDWTTVDPIRSTLLEFYEDVTHIDPVPVEYCTLGQYGVTQLVPGLISLSPGVCQ